MIHVLVLRDAEPCASCDEVLAELESLQREFPEMRIRQKLLEEESEFAERLGVVAAPALVVNDQLAFQGHPDPQFLYAYLNNVRRGLHEDPYAYPPADERHRENQGQEATGSMDPEWRGSGRTPSFGSHPGGRH